MNLGHPLIFARQETLEMEEIHLCHLSPWLELFHLDHTGFITSFITRFTQRVYLSTPQTITLLTKASIPGHRSKKKKKRNKIENKMIDEKIQEFSLLIARIKKKTYFQIHPLIHLINKFVLIPQNR